MVKVTRSGAVQAWVLERDGMYGSVQCIDNYDITGDGVKDLIVGKHDGSIEVYQYEDGEESEPQMKFSHVCDLNNNNIMIICTITIIVYERANLVLTTTMA